jgi:hypothetical protein
MVWSGRARGVSVVLTRRGTAWVTGQSVTVGGQGRAGSCLKLEAMRLNNLEGRVAEVFLLVNLKHGDALF